jgi:hypothetical protein
VNKNKSVETPEDLKFITRSDAAEIAHVSVQTVDAWGKKSLLPIYRPGNGRRALIRLSEFRRFMEAGRR